MPKPSNDDIAISPLDFENKPAPEVAALLKAEADRLFQNGKASAVYALRAALDGSRGSVILSERAFLWMWLCQEVESLERRLHGWVYVDTMGNPDPAGAREVIRQVEISYKALRGRAQAAWEEHGGVLLFDGQLRQVRREAHARAEEHRKETSDGDG